MMPQNHLDRRDTEIYTLSDQYLIFTTLNFKRQASQPKNIHKKKITME